jgi:hypothetical protein
VTMEEIYVEQAKIEQSMLEAALEEARYKAINDVIQATLAVHSAQFTALIYAGLNPNFCKPGDSHK